jgi:hypothetical protein
MHYQRVLWIPAVLSTVVTMSAISAELKTPAPPSANVEGAPGARTLCYWVFAESAEKADLSGAWYLKDMPGKVTDLSQPCVVTNAPGKLDAANKLILTLKPVEGAVRYHVFRTEELPAPKLEIAVLKPGPDTLYYWVQGHNGWRHSALSGPFEARCDRAVFENTLKVVPASPAQNDFSIWVTETPQPPRGRGMTVIGLRRSYSPTTHSAVWVQKNNGMLGAWGPPPEKVTPATAKPVGTGLFLAASTNALTVEDSGLALRETQAPSVNETIPQDFATRLATPQSSRFVHNGNTFSTTFAGEANMAPNFYGGYNPLELNVNAVSGGKNYYQSQPGAYPGYKSTLGVAALTLRSQTESQHCVLQVNLDSQGMGDAIGMDLTCHYHGGVRDGGDEGGELVRSVQNRSLDEGSAEVAEDALVGATVVKVAKLAGSSGTGRTLVNVSRAHAAGRIERVVNCDIHGDGTGWTKAMEGWFISFDVDNVKGKRSWFQVVKVVSPTHLKVLMPTNWRRDINLGMSRFIYNPAKGQKLPSLQALGYTYGGPEPENARETLYSNPLAVGVLPKALEPAAAEGKYQLAPGAFLADPWRAGGGLHVEALAQEWTKGDKLVLAIGISQSMCDWWGLHAGEIGPNDYVGGINIVNWFENRPANGIAFNAQNIGIGMRVTLPADKQGNGVIVMGEPVDGAFLASPDVPALRCYHSAIPYVQGSKARTALEVVAPSGEVPLSVSKDGVSIGGALKGSSQTRGEAVLSGDGKRTTFTVAFARPCAVRPVVLISANQFARSRLAAVDAGGFTVEFEEAPKSGKDNVTISWMAQE